MIPIFICEDDDVQRNQLEAVIKKNIIIEDYDMEVTISTENPDDIIHYLNGKSNSDGIYFLDIELGHSINGIQLGSFIRSNDLDAKIIFITTHSELSLLTFTYKIEALDYIIKDQPEMIRQKIHDCLKTANNYYIADSTIKNTSIKLNIDKKIRIFPLKSVLFFETTSIPHKLCLHLNNSTIEFYANLNDIEKLSNLFVRVHKSFLVNIDNIETIDKKDKSILMVNGEKCLLSVRGLNTLLKRK